VKRTKVTYGQLDKALRMLGFTSRLLQTPPPPALVYEHKDTGASFMIPPFPKTDFVLEYHLVTARVTLDNFGVADPEVFDAQLQKAG
jgi:hypothetical protein